MEAINIDTLDQISRCKNNFKSVGARWNLRDICDLEGDLNFYSVFPVTSIPRIVYIAAQYAAHYKIKTSINSGGELKEPLYCIARR